MKAGSSRSRSSCPVEGLDGLKDKSLVLAGDVRPWQPLSVSLPTHLYLHADNNGVADLAFFGAVGKSFHKGDGKSADGEGLEFHSSTSPSLPPPLGFQNNV